MKPTCRGIKDYKACNNTKLGILIKSPESLTIKMNVLEKKKIRISRRTTKELIKKNQRARGNHNESN